MGVGTVQPWQAAMRHCVVIFPQLCLQFTTEMGCICHLRLVSKWLHAKKIDTQTFSTGIPIGNWTSNLLNIHASLFPRGTRGTERAVKSQCRLIMMDNITERVMRLKMSNVPEDIQQNDYHHLCMYVFFFLAPCQRFSVCASLWSLLGQCIRGCCQKMRLAKMLSLKHITPLPFSHLLAISYLYPTSPFLLLFLSSGD